MLTTLSLRRTENAPAPIPGARPALSTPHSTGACRSRSRGARPLASALHHRRGAGLPRLCHGKPRMSMAAFLRRTAASLRPTAAISNPDVRRHHRLCNAAGGAGTGRARDPTRRPARRTRTLAPGPNPRAETSPSPFRRTWILQPRPPGIAPRCPFRVGWLSGSLPRLRSGTGQAADSLVSAL